MARRPYVPSRHTDAAFDEAELRAFLAGAWVKCTSSHITYARYVADSEELQVGFKSGDRIAYTGILPDMAEDFGRAPSKMGWCWDALIPNKWPFHPI